MSGGGGYGLGGGGRVKEPTVTFRRPLRIHSETENLIELSKAWSSKGDTDSTSVKPSLPSHFNIGSHDTRERSHDIRTRSHDSKRSPHETRWTSRDSSTHYLRPGTTYQSINERGRGTGGATRPPLSSRTRDLLSSPYLGSVGSSHNRSPSPSKHNPSSLFGAADFKDRKPHLHSQPHPQPHPHSVASRPVDVPVVNGVPVTMTRKVVREGGEGGGVKEKRRFTYREEGAIPLSNSQVSSLLERIERQKRDREVLEKKLSSHSDLTSSSHTPSSHSHYVIETAKRRKVATAPPPKGYTGFTSASSRPLTFKPRTHPLPQTTPTSTRPPVQPPADKKTWAVPHQSPVITPSSWRSGQELVKKMLEREVEKDDGEERRSRPSYSSNAHGILRDMETTSEEEEEEEEKEEDPVRKTKPVNPVKQVLKLSETVPVSATSSQPHRQYNRESVQRYMLSKQEERKRKLEEDRATRAAAEADRKRRLQELRERQQNILINNLQAQQKRRETAADEGTSTIHIHFENKDGRHLSSSSHPPSLFTPSQTLQFTPLSSSHPHTSRTTPSRVNANITSPIFTSLAPPTFATPTTTIAPPTQSSADSSFIFSTPVAVMALPTSTLGVSPSPRASLSFSSPYMVTRGTTLPTSSHSTSSTSRLPPPPPPPPSDREVKLLELQSSALSLKQRIENEKKKLDVMTSSPKTAMPIAPPTRIIKSRSYEASTQTLRTLPVPPSATSISVPSPRPLLTARPPVAVTTAPTPVRLPWQQKGGDRFSVINIYTQKQEEEGRGDLTDGESLQEGDSNGGQVEKEREDTESETEEEEEEERKEETEMEEEEVKEKDKDIKDEDISWTAVSPVPSSSSPPPLGGGVSVITPPGSPSFTESFVTPPTTRKLPIHVMETKQSPRYSPQSLGLQLKAELNILEAVEEGVRHVEGVESARAVAEAQQETVALAQILQAQSETQEMKIKEINNKNKERLRETEIKLDKEREERVSVSDQLLKLKEKTQEQTATSDLRLRQLEEESARSHSLAQQQLINTQSELTSAVLHSTQALVESVAKAAAESAVRTAMEERREKEREEEEEEEEGSSSSYDTDFEPQSFETDSLNTSLMTSPMSLPPTSIITTTTRTQSIPPVSHVPSHPRPLTTIIDLPPVASSDSVSTLLSPRLSGGSKSSRTSGTLTPDDTQNISNNGAILASHEEEIEEEIEGGTSVTDEGEESGGGGDKDGANDDIDDVSFRELLPSEAHRRQQRRRLNSNSSDVSDIPNLPITIHSGEGSPLSVGDESFSSFVNRMVSQYVKEEEMRAKHQTALLKLRERAVKEKSQAQLKWLNVKKKSLINKKDDESMPLLLRKEDGVKKKLKQEQAEIKRLQEAHKRASQDRRLLLLQQQDIARLQHSTKQYVEKIRRYGGGTGTSPLHLEYSLSPSPSPLHSPDAIHSEEVSESASLSGSPVKSVSVLEELELSSQSSAGTSTRGGGGAVGGAGGLEMPSSQTSDNYKLMKLKESSEEKEKQLLKYEEKLIKKRQTAEDLLSYKRELERREKQLKEEEGNINRIIEKAIMNEHDNQSITGTKTSTIRHKRGGEHSSVSEDISVYNTDTFETDTAAASTHLTSTPQQQHLGSIGDLSLGSPSDEEDKRLMELQAILIEKEKELKNRKKEAQRVKREQQEKAIKARLIEIEKELKEQSEDELVNTVPSIQITSHDTLVKPVQKQVVPVSEPVIPVREQVLPVRKEEPAKSPLSSSSSSSSSSVSTVISNEAEIEEEITSSLISNNPPSEQTASQAILTSTISAPPTISSAPPTISSAPPTISSVPPITSSVPPITSSAPPTIPTTLVLTSSSAPVLAATPTSAPVLASTPTSAPVLAATPTTAPVTPPISTSAVTTSVEPIPSLLTSTAVVSVVSVTQTIVSHTELITSTTGGDGSTNDALTVAASPRPSPSPLSLTPDISEDTGSNLSLSQRVLVANSVQGVIKYIGTTDFASGVWIGINLDEPRGKNDGSVNGKRYFSCPQKHGVFAPPSKVFPIEEESSGRETSSSISEEFSSEKDERESLSAISPEPLLDNVNNASLQQEEAASGGVQVTGTPLDDDNESYTAISENEETQLDNTLVQEEEEEGEDEQVIKDEEFESVADIWKKKKGDDTEASIDKVTDQLLSALVQSEVDLICNIRDTREALNQGEEEEEEREAVKSKEEDEEVPIEVKINKSGNKERGISFSSALVPNSRQQVNRIVQSAWNTLKNHISSQLAMPTKDQTPLQLTPSQELLNELCNKTGVMLNCEKSFVHLVFNLALRVMEGERTGSLISHKITCSTLEHVQDRVHALLEQRKRPHPLPPLRYLHNNRRTGGKEVDFIDSVLLSEMRQEEPSWINYRLEEDKIKRRTADEILEFLIDETVEVIKDIYAKKQRETN